MMCARPELFFPYGGMMVYVVKINVSTKNLEIRRCFAGDFSFDWVNIYFCIIYSERLQH